MKSIYQTRTAQETIELGIQLASRLIPGVSVLLFGDLGSGKTQFAKGIAKGLGISKLVKSPTFAYVNKFELTSGKHFYHYDLYRLEAGQDFESIGLEETMHDDHSINVIEWADRMAGRTPKEYIQVEFRNLADHHEITIKFEDSEIVPDELVDKFWQDWVTPLHVRAHSKKVTEISLQIGRALVEKNVLINLDLLNTAGLLHDMARVCDFQELDRTKFQEEVTDEKWAKWVDLREQFKGMHHADVACGALAEEGFNKTAELIRLHNSLSILEEPEKFSYLEVAILFYADKRVKHDEVVSLAERFRDGRERHGKYDNPKTQTMFEEVEIRTFELEDQLFSLISLKPNEIEYPLPHLLDIS
jgi:tRNA threonylcarbamoyladenosine biosynthesis protein TsaE